MIEKSKQIEVDENKEIVNGEKQSENEKPSPVTNEETRKEAEAEEDTTAETPSGEEAGRCSNQGVVEGEKQEETKSVWKK